MKFYNYFLWYKKWKKKKGKGRCLKRNKTASRNHNNQKQAGYSVRLQPLSMRKARNPANKLKPKKTLFWYPEPLWNRLYPENYNIPESRKPPKPKEKSRILQAKTEFAFLFSRHSSEIKNQKSFFKIKINLLPLLSWKIQECCNWGIWSKI